MFGGATTNPFRGFIEVWNGDGTGRLEFFGRKNDFSQEPVDLKIADLDGDGVNDVAFLLTDRFLEGHTIQIYLGNALSLPVDLWEPIWETTYTEAANILSPPVLTIVDLTNDDILDLVGQVVANDIAPHSEEIDREGVSLIDGEGVFPDRLARIFDSIKQLELHGMCVPRELGGMNAGLGIVRIDVEDGCLDHLGHVAWVLGEAIVHRFGREADLVVDDDVNRTSGPVIL